MTMTSGMRMLLAALSAALLMLVAACTRDGDTILMPDPTDETASQAPLVTVVYDANALGDRSYNDLVYEGIERAASELGLRTMQLSPQSKEEGEKYLELIFSQMETSPDTVRRLFIVASATYDDFLRRNNRRLEANPYADLLYIETDRPLEGKGSTAFLPYHGAMYEAGWIHTILMRSHNGVLLVGANRQMPAVEEAIRGFHQGFDKGQSLTHKKLTIGDYYIDPTGGSGFSIADTTALRLIRQWGDEQWSELVPVCGGAFNTFDRMIRILSSPLSLMGVDVFFNDRRSTYSVVKHVDRAMRQCLRQWLSAEGMPKHQQLGLADGFTELVVNPTSPVWTENRDRLPDSLRQQIHAAAIASEKRMSERGNNY